MYLVKKVSGLWHVRKAASLLTQFKSASRKTAQEWADAYNAAMAPPPIEYRLNSSVNASVWRPRNL